MKSRLLCASYDCWRRQPHRKLFTVVSSHSELRCAPPRTVRFTGGSFARLAIGVVLIVGGTAAAVELGAEGRRYHAREEAEARRMLAEGRQAEGEVTRLWKLYRYHFVAYRFHIGDWGYEGRSSVAWQRWKILRIGAPITIRYLPSNPTHNYPSTDPPRLLATWPLPVFFGAIDVAAGALLLFMVLRDRCL